MIVFRLMRWVAQTLVAFSLSAMLIAPIRADDLVGRASVVDGDKLKFIACVFAYSESMRLNLINFVATKRATCTAAARRRLRSSLAS